MKHLLIAAVLLAGTAGSAANAYEFNGFRVEGQGGWDRMTVNTRNQGFIKEFRKDGLMYGAEGGYDLRLSDKAILGVFGNYNWSTIDEDVADTLGNRINVDVKNEWSAMGRLGYKISDNTLLYLSGGYAKTKIAYAFTPAGSTTTFNSSDKFGGVRGAVGLEQGLGSNVYAKVEYRYTNYENNLSRHQVVGGLGIRFGQHRPQPVAYEQPAPVAAPMAPAPVAAPLPFCPPAAVTPGPFLVFFDFDQSNITAEAAAILDRAAAQYSETGQSSIILSGHTDTSGAPDYNVALSERRAAAVQAYMASRGVPDSATQARGLGESTLLVQTADGVREAQNRRVEMSFGGAPAQNVGPCITQ